MSKVWTFIGGVITGIAGVVAAVIIDEKLNEHRPGRYSDEEPEEQGRFELP